jgi:hypothetical protein
MGVICSPDRRRLGGVPSAAQGVGVGVVTAIGDDSAGRVRDVLLRSGVLGRIRPGRASSFRESTDER